MHRIFQCSVYSTQGPISTWGRGILDEFVLSAWREGAREEVHVRICNGWPLKEFEHAGSEKGSTNFAIFVFSQVFRLIKSLDSTKPICPDKIPAVLKTSLAESHLQSWQNYLIIVLRRNVPRSMESVSCMPSLQKCRWALDPIKILLHLTKFADTIINKVVNHVNRNNLLSDKKHCFQSSRFTADVLTVIQWNSW